MKDKLKPLVKEAKKAAQKAIQLSLVTHLKEITARFGEGSKKLDKQVEKEAKKLSKKFAKHIKVNKGALIGGDDQSKKEAETVKVPSVKIKAVPAVKKTIAKTNTL
ncbi:MULTISPECIES: hypothetical protein [unclassified Mucilaginibacter]|uniref:hypothetical protein n=1 Tax=unclassified Mucilaginibacter TaxID=2617802 RepID=UPI00138D5D0B|nr:MULTISPECIES: hypothetical protein [unclassified Mucilaginibacter]MBB5394639.1 triphosphoribosyl-dephospho-CoA synthetase [Mucilaginibacter sp. AK015]QHS56972.1 hypothetical protein GWR56_16005 [Mucilaginibacter sp. 14171R-50]